MGAERLGTNGERGLEIALASVFWRHDDRRFEQKIAEGDVILRATDGRSASFVKIRIGASEWSTLTSDHKHYVPRLSAEHVETIAFRVVSLQPACALRVAVEFMWEDAPDRLEREEALLALGPETMGEEGMAFVSYASVDLPRLLPFFGGMHLRGIRTWTAETDLAHDPRWFPEAIRQAVGRARWFVVFLSRPSAASRWVTDEIDLALASHSTGRLSAIVPVTLDAGAAYAPLHAFDAIPAYQFDRQTAIERICSRLSNCSRR